MSETEMHPFKSLWDEAREVSHQRADETSTLITKLVDETERRIREAFASSGLASEELNAWLNNKWLSDVIGREAWYYLDWTAGMVNGSKMLASALGRHLSKDIQGSSEMHADLWTRPAEPGYVIRSEAREIRFWFYQYQSPD